MNVIKVNIPSVNQGGVLVASFAPIKVLVKLPGLFGSGALAQMNLESGEVQVMS